MGVCLVGIFTKNMNTRFLKFLYVFSALLIIQSCKKSGCTDPEALNYNVDAQKDDNGCLYEDYDKLSLLTNLADNYIIPSMRCLQKQSCYFKHSCRFIYRKPKYFQPNTSKNELGRGIT